MASPMKVSSHTHGAHAATSQFPAIDPKDPAESFFELIRAGKWQDDPFEFGAKATMKEDLRIINALVRNCADPKFLDQTVAGKQIERLLNEIDNPDRFILAQNIVLTLRHHEKEDFFSRMVELIVMSQKPASDVEDYAKDLLDGDYVIDTVREFAKDYYRRDENIRPLFVDLVKMLEKVQAKR